MVELEIKNMPNDSDQEIDVSASSFDDPLNGNDLTHPLETPLNLSESAGSGLESGLPETSPLVGVSNHFEQVKSRTLETPRITEDQLEELQKRVNEAHYGRSAAKLNREDYPIAVNIKEAVDSVVPPGPGPHSIDSILDAADQQELNEKYGDSTVRDLRRGKSIAEIVTNPGELKYLTDKHGIEVMKLLGVKGAAGFTGLTVEEIRARRAVGDTAYDAMTSEQREELSRTLAFESAEVGGEDEVDPTIIPTGSDKHWQVPRRRRAKTRYNPETGEQLENLDSKPDPERTDRVRWQEGFYYRGEHGYEAVRFDFDIDNPGTFVSWVEDRILRFESARGRFGSQDPQIVQQREQAQRAVQISRELMTLYRSALRRRLESTRPEDRISDELKTNLQTRIDRMNDAIELANEQLIFRRQLQEGYFGILSQESARGVNGAIKGILNNALETLWLSKPEVMIALNIRSQNFERILRSNFVDRSQKEVVEKELKGEIQRQLEELRDRYCEREGGDPKGKLKLREEYAHIGARKNEKGEGEDGKMKYWFMLDDPDFLKSTVDSAWIVSNRLHGIFMRDSTLEPIMDRKTRQTIDIRPDQSGDEIPEIRANGVQFVSGDNQLWIKATRQVFNLKRYLADRKKSYNIKKLGMITGVGETRARENLGVDLITDYVQKFEDFHRGELTSKLHDTGLRGVDLENTVNDRMNDVLQMIVGDTKILNPDEEMRAVTKYRYVWKSVIETGVLDLSKFRMDWQLSATERGKMRKLLEGADSDMSLYTVYGEKEATQEWGRVNLENADTARDKVIQIVRNPNDTDKAVTDIAEAFPSDLDEFLKKKAILAIKVANFMRYDNQVYYGFSNWTNHQVELFFEKLAKFHDGKGNPAINQNEHLKYYNEALEKEEDQEENTRNRRRKYLKSTLGPEKYQEMKRLEHQKTWRAIRAAGWRHLLVFLLASLGKIKDHVSREIK